MKKIFQISFFIITLWSFGAGAQNPDHLKKIGVRSIGPGAMSGRVTCLAADPFDDNTLYAGAASGGVWRSRSGGAAWEPIFDEAPTQSVGAIAINPNNPDEIWVGTGEGNPRNSQNFGIGLFKSIDGGETWKQVGLETSRAIHRIIVHPLDPQTVWVAVLGSAYGPNEERGVFKTTNGGQTWRKVLYVNELTGCADLVIDPRNPNKLIAAMWEYERKPYFFTSGGKGSGLYVSFDGGENWTRRTEADGLPKGNLGRMGLAIAPSNPDVVYALVEAEDNALYKSTDGGRKWRQMTDKNMGNRPFYYSDIFVDPSDENTVYSVHSQITRSIDGGRTFDNWISYWRIHPDHHAFWINPKNPKHIIDGNDGGLNISLDGGETWRYAENIPLGQFYHINVDNEMPYNVYGGLQDNGTWIGPSAVWKSGGLRNSEWQEVYFGDGFDAMPQADDSRYCFAMSQGGELSHIDRQTGYTRYIKPLHPDGLELRWNWNAGMAQDPFNPKGLYFGSQFLHYSADLGHNWQLISPDLTTNDTAKLHQDVSGGLTIDATNAENYCSIIAIAPSPAEQGVVWVGTDDGNLQLTRDGGETWENINKRLPDLPKNAWIPHIEVSRKNAGEAFVVANNYRQNDWDPYLYHTRDFGRTWTRLAGPRNVKGFCLSVAQDTEVPELLFLGTDQGLYFSLDYGKQWQHWPNKGLPSMPVADMKIQERDGDLVLGTFGRGIWILDNLAPLRELAKAGPAMLDQPFKVFQPQPAVLASYASYHGPRFAGDTEYYGDNKGPSARIPVWNKPKAPESEGDKKGGKKKDKKENEAEEEEQSASRRGRRGGGDKATVVVLNMQGDTLRRWKTELDTAFTQIYWGLDTRGVEYPSNRKPDRDQLEPGGGPRVLPGQYKILVHFGDHRDSAVLTVLEDPRLALPPGAREAEAAALREFFGVVEKATKAYERLKEMEKTIGLVESQLSNVPDSTKKEALKLGKTLKDSIGVYKERFFTQKEGKGIQRNPDNLNARLWRARSYIGASEGPPNAAARIAIGIATTETEKLVGDINALTESLWKEFRQKAEAVRYSLFEEWDKL